MRIAISGANGRVGSAAVAALQARGHRLCCNDVAGQAPAESGDAQWLIGDLCDPTRLDQLLEGAEVLVHMAATLRDDPIDKVIDNNHRLVHAVYEGARRHGLRRVVYASSNHAYGLYPPGQVLRLSDPPLADCYYGLSKVWGEALARMYWTKHGIETVALRIGSYFNCPPRSTRELSTWIGRDDMQQLLWRAVEQPVPGFAPVWGISANTRAWYDLSEANAIGYVPVQNAEGWAAVVTAQPETPDPVADAWQGGRFVRQAWTDPQDRPGAKHRG